MIMRYKNKGRCIVHKFDIKPLKSFTANMYNFIPILQEKNDPNLSARDFSNWSRINENNRYTAKQIKRFYQVLKLSSACTWQSQCKNFMCINLKCHGWEDCKACCIYVILLHALYVVLLSFFIRMFELLCKKG